MMHIRIISPYAVSKVKQTALVRPWKGVPGIPYPFKYFEKYPISLKGNWQISLKFTQLQKALYHHIPKNTLNFHKSITYPSNYLPKTPISLKTLPGPYHFLNIFKLPSGLYAAVPIGTASVNSVESDLGCTLRVYFDNATLTSHNMTLTLQKPCQYNNKLNCSETNGYNISQDAINEI